MTAVHWTCQCCLLVMKLHSAVKDVIAVGWMFFTKLQHVC